MTLKEDIYQQVWVWVDDTDESIEISPHFDYEDDAHDWKEKFLNKGVSSTLQKE